MVRSERLRGSRFLDNWENSQQSVSKNKRRDATGCLNFQVFSKGFRTGTAIAVTDYRRAVAAVTFQRDGGHGCSEYFISTRQPNTD